MSTALGRRTDTDQINCTATSRSTLKCKQFYRVIPCTCQPRRVDVNERTHELSCSLTERQMEWQTDKHNNHITPSWLT